MNRDLDLAWVRSRFPAFAEPSLRAFRHFENAGGSYACGPVIDCLSRYYRETKVQPYYDFAPSRRAGELMDRARERMAAWLNARPDEIHFGPSTTQNTYVIGQALRHWLKPGDEIIVTNQDHEANIGAWRRLEEEGFRVLEWRVDPDNGELDPAGLDALLGERTRVVAFTHCSNLVGSINPVASLVARVHSAGALAIVDGVSFAPHALPDLSELGADVYTFSLYKVYGPHLGVMYLSRALNEQLPSQGHFFNAGSAAGRFTPAGPDHAQIAAANGVLDYLDDLHAHHFGSGNAPPAERAKQVSTLFRKHEGELLPPLLSFLDQHPRVRLLGSNAVTPTRAPTVAFSIDGQAPAAVCARLGARNIGVGAGHFYAYRLVRALGLDPDSGVLRTSFVHYTSPEEVSDLIEALDETL